MSEATMNQVRIGLIGGTGLGEALGAERGQQHEVDTPFGRPSSPLTVVEWGGVEVVVLQRHGPGHVLKPGQVPYRANIFAMKALGVTHVLASGAVGSLREHIEPGDLVIVDQIIDKTLERERTFYERAAVHVEFAEPFCPVMRGWLMEAARGLKREQPELKVHDGGTYVCMEGPQFSTRAESLMHREWGGDVVGMTAIPEAKLAREAELAYAMVAMPTDYDCWRPHNEAEPESEEGVLEAIVGNLTRATASNLTLIKKALANVGVLGEQPSPAHDALRLAIWSDKSKLDEDYVRELEPLWGRHFTAERTQAG